MLVGKEGEALSSSENKAVAEVLKHLDPTTAVSICRDLFESRSLMVGTLENLGPLYVPYRNGFQLRVYTQ